MRAGVGRSQRAETRQLSLACLAVVDYRARHRSDPDTVTTSFQPHLHLITTSSQPSQPHPKHATRACAGSSAPTLSTWVSRPQRSRLLHAVMLPTDRTQMMPPRRIHYANSRFNFSANSRASGGASNIPPSQTPAQPRPNLVPTSFSPHPNLSQPRPDLSPQVERVVARARSAVGCAAELALRGVVPHRWGHAHLVYEYTSTLLHY